MFGSAVAIETAFTPVSNDLRASPGGVTSSPLWWDEAPPHGESLETRHTVGPMCCLGTFRGGEPVWSVAAADPAALSAPKQGRGPLQSTSAGLLQGRGNTCSP